LVSKSHWNEIVSPLDLESVLFISLQYRWTVGSARLSLRIQDDLLFILSNYRLAKASLDELRTVRARFKLLQQKIGNLSVVRQRKNILINFGTGIGAPADVPWLALLDARETNTTRKGVYCVYLFTADMSGVYATFNQGVGASASEAPTKERMVEVQQIAAKLQADMQWLKEKGFRLDKNISLNAHSVTGRAYEKSTIAYRFYPKNNLPSDAEFEADLQILLNAYDEYLARKSVLTPPITEYTPPETPSDSKPEPQIEQTQDNIQAYTVEMFSEETGFDAQTINVWLEMLKRKQHLIFQGPPGTGKTFVAQRLARLLVSGTIGFVEKVQFHPDYSYEDFIQGYFPEPANGGLEFKLKKGVFLKFCEAVSTKSNGAPCALVIDEINRANLSRVFGELMYLLEYRNDSIPLAAGGLPFQIPQNIYIIGTMNTADRSIALVDHALRRRFSFVRLKPQYEVLEKRLRNLGLPSESLIQILKSINQTIDDQNYELGISFFMNDGPQLKKRLGKFGKAKSNPTSKSTSMTNLEKSSLSDGRH
jgi:MoxR-like ATPase